MTFRDTIYEIFEAFNSPLPGYEAHIEMAPYRKKVELNFEKNKPKIASTLLLLYPKDNDIYFCLIERTEYKGTHSKQISFPGGRNENGETIKETALRECYEEIGVPTEEINIIGEMTQVYVPPSNYLIHPFVGYCDTKPTFIADPREVKTIIEIKMNELSKPDLVKNKKMNFGSKDQRFQADVPYLDLNDKIVWGATSVVLNEFRIMLKL